jgi:hypothetical protein
MTDQTQTNNILERVMLEEMKRAVDKPSDDAWSKALEFFNGIVISFNAISSKPLREDIVQTIRAALMQGAAYDASKGKK